MINKTRYSRQMILPQVGEIGQQKLQNARVLIVGSGGLGCPVLQNLAAAGIGNLGIVDGDVVEETNLHRQLLYSLNDCGKSKAETAKKAILRLNPEVKVVAFSEYFNKQNAARIVQGYQIIVDCTDTIAVRYLINDVAIAKCMPVVYASIHKFEGQVSVFNYKNGPSYRCLFPEPEGLDAIPNCTASGVLGILPNTIGILQATEVLKMILDIGQVLSGKLLLYDALHFQTQVIDFEKNPKAIESGLAKGLAVIQSSEKTNTDLTQEAFLEKCNQNHCLVIDIRESCEEPKFNGETIINVPLVNLEDYSEKLDKNQEIVLFCQTGQRSQMAVNYLKKEGFVAVYHLKNGIQTIEKSM